MSELWESELRSLTWILSRGTELTSEQAARYDELVRRSLRRSRL